MTDTEKPSRAQIVAAITKHGGMIGMYSREMDALVAEGIVRDWPLRPQEERDGDVAPGD